MKLSLFLIFYLMYISNSKGQILKSIGIIGGTAFSHQKYEIEDANPYGKYELDFNKLFGLTTSVTGEVLNLNHFYIETNLAVSQMKAYLARFYMDAGAYPPRWEGDVKGILGLFYLGFYPKFIVRLQKNNYALNGFSGINVQYLLSYNFKDLNRYAVDISGYNIPFPQTIVGLIVGGGMEYLLIKERISLLLIAHYQYDFLRLVTVFKNGIYFNYIGIKYYFNKRKK